MMSLDSSPHQPPPRQRGFSFSGFKASLQVWCASRKESKNASVWERGVGLPPNRSFPVAEAGDAYRYWIERGHCRRDRGNNWRLFSGSPDSYFLQTHLSRDPIHLPSGYGSGEANIRGQSSCQTLAVTRVS